MPNVSAMSFATAADDVGSSVGVAADVFGECFGVGFVRRRRRRRSAVRRHSASPRFSVSDSVDVRDSPGVCGAEARTRSAVLGQVRASPSRGSLRRARRARCLLALVLITKATKALGLYLRPDAFGVARDQPDLPGGHETLTHCLRLRP